MLDGLGYAAAMEAAALPAPTSDRVLMRVAMQAAILTASPRQRKRLTKIIRKMGEILATEESVSAILPIRPASDHADVQQARRQAMAVFHALLPMLVALLSG